MRQCRRPWSCCPPILVIALGSFFLLLGGQRVRAEREAVTELRRKLAPMIEDAQPIFFVEFPFEGQIGEDLPALWIERALKDVAKQPLITEVVLHIDSSGGSVEAAEKMVEVIDHFRHRFTFHAAVERAKGEAAAIALACDMIHMEKNSRLGARAPSEVDGSYPPAGYGLRALRPVLERAAERYGLGPVLVWGLVNRHERVHADPTDSGSPRLSVCPERARAELVSKSGEPLVLDGETAVKLGLAEELPERRGDRPWGEWVLANEWPAITLPMTWRIDTSERHLLRVKRYVPRHEQIIRWLRWSMNHDPRRYVFVRVRGGRLWVFDRTRRLTFKDFAQEARYCMFYYRVAMFNAGWEYRVAPMEEEFNALAQAMKERD